MRKYTRFDAQSFNDAMIYNMDSIGKYMLEITVHQQRTLQLLKQKKLMQTQDHSNPIQALYVNSLKVDLVVIQNGCSEKEDSNSETASSKSVKECSLDSATNVVHAIKYKMPKAKERCMAYFRSLHSHLQFTLDYDSQMTDKYFAEYTGIEVTQVNKRQMQTQKSKIDTGKAVDAGLVVTESSGTESEVQDNSSMSGNDTDADNADIRLIYDEEPMAEVQLTAECNIFAIGQQHTEQPEIINEEQTTSLLANNAGLKAQIQEKVFAIAALKNDLRKLKENSVDTKFAKTSVLRKPVLQSLRNQSVVRQPNAFKSERPQIESRDSSKNLPRFSSNDKVHNHYLDEARKKTQKRDKNLKTKVIASTRFQSTSDGSKPKHRRNNQTPRSLSVSKSSNNNDYAQSRSL
nr:hypothetical protein [Tanacetum cinerariifolium]GEV70049.1 hypothetical protein [Tanacetum cinerariifolium]